MKKLVKTVNERPWMPESGIARLYITDEIPPIERCSTAFGFVFDDEKILLTRLRDRDWDIPGGVIDPGETPEDAAIREVWEETVVVSEGAINAWTELCPSISFTWNYPAPFGHEVGRPKISSISFPSTFSIWLLIGTETAIVVLLVLNTDIEKTSFLIRDEFY